MARPQIIIGTQGSGGSEENRLPRVLPILPLRDMVLFPEIVTPIMVGREPSKRLIDESLSKDKLIVVTAMKDPQVPEPSPDDLYSIGTAARIVQMFKFPDGTMRVVVEGIARVRILRIISSSPFMVGEIEPVEIPSRRTERTDALVRSVLATFQKMVELAPYIPDQLFTAAINISEPENLADFMASNVNISTQERQELLETFDVEERLSKLLRILNRELKILEMGFQIQKEVESEVEAGQREIWLRKQLEAIRRELGEIGEESAEIEEFRKRLAELEMPDEARKEAERELARLEKIPPVSPEHSVIRTYLDWLLNYPWGQRTQDNLDVAAAEKILNDDHYDLEKVKERILEYLAVRKLKQDMRGPILCFVGPPGVGKTSLGKSIARALGRNFVRMSLGGVRDEAEIRGHRRTYIGAMPGRIVQAIRRAGTMNPVMMLDEIDKIGTDFRGDPAAALLEVLDPEQNSSFRDHYLDVPIDLSEVMFIGTANILDTIPPTLRDRLEIIEIPGYTQPQKVEIAKHYLIPKELTEHGLNEKQVVFEDEALAQIIEGYTREAGVRDLERRIATVARKAALKIASGKRKVKVDKKVVREFLGPAKFKKTVAEEKDAVGVVPGLAVTGTGGEILFVECRLVPGKGSLTLTGQLGEVMQESARAALTLARSYQGELVVGPDWWEKYDVHIHVPAGAVPKDGPSAGVTITTALVSAITGRPARRDVGMTGEITLRGKVLAVGGIEEKLLAALRGGLKVVVLPAENAPDLEEVPEFVKESLQIVLVDTVDEVLDVALSAPGAAQPKKRESQGRKKALRKTAVAASGRDRGP
jgi:ATP-dependent Lon protease